MSTPQIQAGEVGTVNATTVVITFDQNVSLMADPPPQNPTTLPAHGGSAQPVHVDTSGNTTGGPALRCYVFADEAAAKAAGYLCEAGPAMSVALISAAQLATGAWKAEGDPKALAVYIAPAGMAIEGGYAVPIVQVN